MTAVPRPFRVPPPPRRRAVGVSAVTISLLLHTLALAAGVAIHTGASVARLANFVGADATFEARVVAVTSDDGPVVRQPPAERRDEIPRTRGGGDDAALATNLVEADDEPPPPAAPSIAVAAEPSCRHAPREWSPTPRVTAGGVSGLGRGGRRPGGHGRGGVGRGGDGTGTGDGAAAAHVQVVESPPSPLPAPPVVVAARVLSYVQPRYPESARDRGIEGVVRCECDVLCDGSVGDVRVVESSGFASLDAAAVAVVKRWTFAAATSDGVAFESTITLPAIRFRLQ